MKKLIAIFLLLQFLTNNSFAGEVIKLPKLFTHYYHHSREHKDTKDFIDFLKKHYSGQQSNTDDIKNHNDEDSDCQLPFKHCNNCISVHAPVLAYIPSGAGAGFVFAVELTRKYRFENEKIKSTCSTSIWQPPKLL